MSNIHVDKVGDMAVVECEGRFVRSDEAFRLRDAVASQRDAHVIVLDLTEMRAIGGGAIGVLVFLHGGRAIVTYGSSCSILRGSSKTSWSTRMHCWSLTLRRWTR